jgi:ABC-2 type transport system ATP-binding protein
MMANPSIANPTPVRPQFACPALVLAVEGLTKRYNGLTAVDGISFSVDKGETFGILGPNGAGKTTTLEVIEGLRAPDGGSVTLLGLDAIRQRGAVQQRIGVQLQSQALWPDLTVEETLRTFGSLFRSNVPMESLLQRFSLSEKRRALVKTLSGGQRQRLAVAVALVNDPEVVFLDEPTTGLDPQARHDLWSLVQDIRRDGKTVILTTHYMEEAESLCNRVAIMDKGRIIALDTPRRLIRDLAFDSTLECTFSGPVQVHELRGLPSVTSVRNQDETVVLCTADVSSTLPALSSLAERAGVRIHNLLVRTATLEDVFISLTGKPLRD